MAGIRIASAAYSVAVIRIVPAGFSRSSLRAPSSTSISSNLGPIVSSSRSPACVGVTLRVVRFSSLTPNRSSRVWTIWLRVGWLIASRAAARVKLRSLATARKARRSLASARSIYRLLQSIQLGFII